MATVTGTKRHLVIESDTLNTGQGANELYDMDQNVLTTSDVTFATISATSLNVTSITSSIVTSSILKTEGSNIFGDASNDTHTFNGNITVTGTVDGRDVAADGTKLEGIEDNATADQTAAEIRTLVGTGNNNFVPAEGATGEFLKHDGTFGTPSYTTNTDTNTQLTTEQVQDIVGGMFSSNTETRISATYVDGDGTIDLVVNDMTANDNDDVSVANLKTRLAGGFGSNAVQIGDSTDTITIPGNLTVQGSQTINNVTLIETSNGVVFEGTTADAHETTLIASDPSTDRTYTLPNKSGTVAMTSDITGTNSGTNTGDQDLSSYQLQPSEGAFVNGDKTKLDGIATSANAYAISDDNASNVHFEGL